MIEAVGSRGIVVLTWDENDNGPRTRSWTLAVGAPVKHGFVSARAVNHYTLLRTICDALKLHRRRWPDVRLRSPTSGRMRRLEQSVG